MSSGSSRPYEQAPGRGECLNVSGSPFDGGGCDALTCAHALFALFQLGEELKVPRHLRDRHDCGCGGIWFFSLGYGSVLSRESWRSRVVDGENDQVVGVCSCSGAWSWCWRGPDGLLSGARGGHSIQCQAMDAWNGGVLAQDSSCSSSSPSRGAGLVILHPCVSLDNDDQAPSSSSSGQQLARDLLSFPFTSRLQHQRASTSLTSHLNKLTLSCNGNIKKHILEMPS